MGRLLLEVSTRTGDVIARSEEVFASTDGRDLIWACKNTVTWDGSESVTILAIMDPYGLQRTTLKVTL